MQEEQKNSEMYMLMLKALDEHAAHHKPSKETIKRLDGQDDKLGNLFTLIQKHMDDEKEYRRKELQPLIDAWKEYAGFGAVSKRVFSGTIKFLIGIGVIFTSTYALKEWIKK